MYICVLTVSIIVIGLDNNFSCFDIVSQLRKAFAVRLCSENREKFSLFSSFQKSCDAIASCDILDCIQYHTVYWGRIMYCSSAIVLLTNDFLQYLTVMLVDKRVSKD